MSPQTVKSVTCLGVTGKDTLQSPVPPGLVFVAKNLTNTKSPARLYLLWALDPSKADGLVPVLVTTGVHDCHVSVLKLFHVISRTPN
jgi:hypothetical protein